jgi:hypothetical protein
MKRFCKISAVFVAALVTAGVSSQASAANLNACVVSDVGVWGAYNGGNTPTVPALYINCGGTGVWANQYAPAQGGSCAGWSADIIKLWQTQATTAFLSGKHLNISYNPADSNCSSPTITQIHVVN